METGHTLLGTWGIFVGDVGRYVLSTPELERLVPVTVVVGTDGAPKVVWCKAVQGYEWILKVIDQVLKEAGHFRNSWGSLWVVFKD